MVFPLAQPQRRLEHDKQDENVCHLFAAETEIDKHYHQQ